MQGIFCRCVPLTIIKEAPSVLPEYFTSSAELPRKIRKWGLLFAGMSFIILDDGDSRFNATFGKNRLPQTQRNKALSMMRCIPPLFIAVFLFGVSQGFSAAPVDDPFDFNPDAVDLTTPATPPLEESVPPVETPASASPYPTQPAAQPVPLSSQPKPLAAKTVAVSATLRSQMDPNHPFYQLQLDTAPVDPNSTITGKSLTICEMLESVSSPQTRCELLHAYWKLSGEIAKYKITLFKQTQLTKWSGEIGSTSPKFPTFQAAEKKAIAETKSQEILVTLRQMELASLLKQTGYIKSVVQANQAGTEQLPIPCDLPFILVYQTHVNQLVQYRPGSNLLLLDKTISLRKQLFEAKLQEFSAAEDFFGAVQDSMMKSQSSAEALILAHGQYLTEYAEYTDAIIAYNESIADYVAETVGPEITGRRLLMTLIKLNPEEPENAADQVPVVKQGP